MTELHAGVIAPVNFPSKIQDGETVFSVLQVPVGVVDPLQMI